MIFQIFCDSLHKNPNSPVFISLTRQLSYTELLARVNQCANFLLAEGITDQDKVAVQLQDSCDYLIALLALDRINAIFVPVLDIDDSIAPLAINYILCAQQFARINTYNCDIPKYVYTPDDNNISYIVASSGSTGKKKWIPIKSYGLGYWAQRERERMSGMPVNILNTCSPAYDACIFEILSALSTGGTVYDVFPNALEKRNLSYIATILPQYPQINTVLLMAAQLNFNADILQNLYVENLLVTGDAVLPQVKDICEKRSINLWNCYGPTEATFGFSILKVNNLPVVEVHNKVILPIGKPQDGIMQYQLIDDVIYIESPCLALDYIADDVANLKNYKYLSDNQGHAHRIFNTGDLFLSVGDYLYYQGRASIDAHCKINGVKVMPSEIEVFLNQYQGIHACVIYKEYFNHQYKLFAYITCPATFDKSAFYLYLKNNLKAEEFPLVFVVSELPVLNVSGKIDRQALQHRQDDFAKLLFNDNNYYRKKFSYTDAEYQAYKKRNITIISRLFTELLGIENINIKASFTAMGGDSINAMALVRKIQTQIYLPYCLHDLFSLDPISIEEIAEQLCLLTNTNQSNLCLLNYGQNHTENLFILPALLGEGYMSYRHLGNLLQNKLSKNVYALSDPIYTSGQFYADLKHLSAFYIALIKSLQPSGPYYLMGFSFGTILAMDIARSLIENGDEVAELYLLDGFPPMVYQYAYNNTYALFLYNLCSYLHITLQNSFYDEQLPPLSLTKTSHLDKSQQIQAAFLQFKVTKKLSVLMLKAVQRNLEYLLAYESTPEKLELCPVLYLSDIEDEYWDIMRPQYALQTIITTNHVFWNHYFTELRLSGKKFGFTHLDFLTNPNVLGAWSLQHDNIWNANYSFYTPHMCYSIFVEGDSAIVMFYFVPAYLGTANILARYSKDIAVFACDKEEYFSSHGQTDSKYLTLKTIRAKIQTSALESLQKHILSICPRVEPQTHYGAYSSAKSLVTIDFFVMWCSTKILTFSFKVSVEINDVISLLNKKFRRLNKFQSRLAYYSCIDSEVDGMSDASQKAIPELVELMNILYLPHQTTTSLRKGFFESAANKRSQKEQTTTTGLHLS
jgi:thioesterase domain-containing protein/acyl-CoA synthetase (AMP-forming)/AMP-acid ligase II